MRRGRIFCYARPSSLSLIHILVFSVGAKSDIFLLTMVLVHYISSFFTQVSNSGFLSAVLPYGDVYKRQIKNTGNRMDNNQVENECQRILPEIRSMHPDQNTHRNQKQINIVDDRIHGRTRSIGTA